MSFMPSPPPIPHEGLVPSVTVFRLLVATAGALGIKSMAFAQMSLTGACENALKDAKIASASKIFFIRIG
jgi:hypothetical protein